MVSMQGEDLAGKEAAASQLAAGVKMMAISLTEEMAAKMLAYLQLLQKWNGVYNLTKVTRLTDMVDYHLLDSLTLMPFLRGSTLLDVGTGAGLPGIPIAIARPDIKVCLLDAGGKKIRFVTQAVIELGLENVKVVHSRIEAFGLESTDSPADQQTGFENGFDNIVCRAFTNLDNFVKNTRHFSSCGGQWLAMKGRREELETSELAWQIESVDLPHRKDERHVLIHPMVEG